MGSLRDKLLNNNSQNTETFSKGITLREKILAIDEAKKLNISKYPQLDDFLNTQKGKAVAETLQRERDPFYKAIIANLRKKEDELIKASFAKVPVFRKSDEQLLREHNESMGLNNSPLSANEEQKAIEKDRFIKNLSPIENTFLDNREEEKIKNDPVLKGNTAFVAGATGFAKGIMPAYDTIKTFSPSSVRALENRRVKAIERLEPVANMIGATTGSLISSVAISGAIAKGLVTIPKVANIFTKISNPVLKKYAYDIAEDQVVNAIISTPTIIYNGVKEGKPLQEIINNVLTDAVISAGMQGAVTKIFGKKEMLKIIEDFNAKKITQSELENEVGKLLKLGNYNAQYFNTKGIKKAYSDMDIADEHNLINTLDEIDKATMAKNGWTIKKSGTFSDDVLNMASNKKFEISPKYENVYNSVGISSKATLGEMQEAYSELGEKIAKLANEPKAVKQIKQLQEAQSALKNGINIGIQFFAEKAKVTPETTAVFLDDVKKSITEKQSKMLYAVAKKKYGNGAVQTLQELAKKFNVNNYTEIKPKQMEAALEHLGYIKERPFINTLEDFKSEIVRINDGRVTREEIDSLGEIIKGQASYHNMTPDEFVNKFYVQPQRGGKPAEGALFSTDMSFSEQVDNAINNADFSKSHLSMGNTPEILSKFGFDTEKPLLITSKHIKDMTTAESAKNSSFHGLTKNQIKQLPEKIKEPAIVMISNSRPNDSIVIVTTLIDSKKRPIIASIKINGSGNYNEVEISANIITSSYGRNNFKGFLANAFSDNRMLYVDKKLSHQLRQTPGVQFPNNLPNGDFTNNIQHFKDVVNTNISKNIENDTKNILGNSVDGTVKASVEFVEDGRAIIRAFQGANIADMTHETAHIFRRTLDGDDLRIAENFCGVIDGRWTREAEEKFAKGFEKYLMEGVSPTAEMQGVFDKFKKWLTEIYKGFKNEFKDELTPEIRGLFDRATMGGNQKNIYEDVITPENLIKLKNASKSGDLDTINKAIEELSKDIADSAVKSDDIAKQWAVGIQDYKYAVNKNWSNPNMYQVNTLEQIVKDITNGRPALYEHLMTNYVEPLFEAKKAFATANREATDRIANDIVKKYGITKGSKLSAAIQEYGEGVRVKGSKKVMNVQTGKMEMQADTVPYKLADLKAEFPNDWQKVVEAEKVSRKIYDEYVEKINTALKQIYPNVETNALKELKKFKEGASGVSSKIKNIENSVKQIDTKIDNYNLQIDAKKQKDTKVILQLKNQVSKLEAKKQSYLADIAKEQLNMKGFNDKALKLQRDIKSGRAYEGKRLMPRKDYYHHIQEINEAESLKTLITNSAQIDPTLQGKTGLTKPNSKFEGFLQRRGNGMYKPDAIAGLLSYIPAAESKIHIDPLIPKFRQLAKDIAEGTKDARTTNANGFIQYLQDFTNRLAGKSSGLERFAADNAIGREGLMAIKLINNRIAKNTILGNASSLVSQVFNIPNGMALIKDPVAMAKGIANTFVGLDGNSEIGRLYAESGFLSERFLDKNYRRFDTNLKDLPLRYAKTAMEGVDEISTKFIWNSAYELAIKKGVSNPIAYADKLTREAVAGRGIGEIPLMYQDKIIKLFIPFSVEVNGTYRLWKRTIGAGDMAGIAYLLGANWMLNNLSEQLIGRRIGPDPIDAVIDSIMDSQREEDDFPTTAKKVVGRLVGETIGNIPGGTFIFNALDIMKPNSEIPFTGLTPTEFFGDNDPGRYGGGILTSRGIENPLFYLLPSFGGGQIKKTYEGVEALIKGGSYTKNGELRFPIEQEPINALKVGVFGQYAAKEALPYFKEHQEPIGGNILKAYKYAITQGIKPQVFVDANLYLKSLKPIPPNKRVTPKQMDMALNNYIRDKGIDARTGKLLMELIVYNKKWADKNVKKEDKEE